MVPEALKFMVLGMSIVFLFLVVMIYVLKLQSYLVTKFLPEKQKVIAPKISEPKVMSASNEMQIVAAITAAIWHHKNIK